eukprot:1182490-Pleurochrysis_carterae.AAC.2
MGEREWPRLAQGRSEIVYDGSCEHGLGLRKLQSAGSRQYSARRNKPREMNKKNGNGCGRATLAVEACGCGRGMRAQQGKK